MWQVSESRRKFTCDDWGRETYHRPFDALAEEILEESNSGCYIPKILPSLDDIQKAVLRAKKDAEADLAKIGNFTRYFIGD